MTFSYRTAAIALTATLGFVASAGGLAAHQGHGAKAPAKPMAGGQPMMPTMKDAEFAEMMTKHHEGAIEMAKIEESRGTRDPVKALATKIREAQAQEVKAMAVYHADHAKMGKAGTMPDAHGTAGHAGSGAMMKQHEMMEGEAMAATKRLEAASGAAVDHAFLDAMTKHHRMALQMISKAQIKDAKLRKMAQKMAADQKREIGEFQKLQSR